MPQSLAQVYLHIVFSTKNRQPFLGDTSSREGAFFVWDYVMKPLRGKEGFLWPVPQGGAALALGFGMKPLVCSIQPA
jgi:hypothetical protein